MGRRNTRQTQPGLKTKAKSLARVRSAGTLPWLGFYQVQPTDRFSRKVLSHQLIRRCCTDPLNPHLIKGEGLLDPVAQRCGVLLSAIFIAIRNEADLFRNQQSRTWSFGVNHGSIRDSWPIAFSGHPRGPRVACETWCPKHAAPNLSAETRSRTRVFREPTATARENPWDEADSFRDTQAVCDFRCWASKLTPLFHTINTIVAIFLAKVSRAISGRMPLASKAK